MSTLSLPTEVRQRLADTGYLLTGQGVTVATRSGLAEDSARVRSPIEVRLSDDGKVSLAGYATTWESKYDVAGGAPYGWTETIARGAAKKSLRERDDVRFLLNHDGLPLARTKSKTMRLSADDTGLLVEVDDLDLTNPRAQELASSLQRGDVDQMSFAFMTTRQEWNEDYTERRILEVRLFDVSAVSYPANEATVIALRDDEPAMPKRGLSLALVEAELLTL